METSELLPILEAKVPGAVLEVRPLGRSGQISVWVEAGKLGQLAEVLAHDPKLAMTWLENLSVFEIEGALVLTYFLRSIESGSESILRASVNPDGEEARVKVPTVSKVWRTAEPFEREASELFGIDFTGLPATEIKLLPKNLHGFPLRKSFVFPAEVSGIPHARPVGRTSPDEHEVLQ